MPYLLALRDLILKWGYAVLTAGLLILIVHLSGCTLMHYLRTRHKFPVSRVYITSCVPCAPDKGLAHRGGGGVNMSKESESESEDLDHSHATLSSRGGSYKSYPTRVRLSPEKAHTKADTSLLPDFKYSETKV